MSLQGKGVEFLGNQCIKTGAYRQGDKEKNMEVNSHVLCQVDLLTMHWNMQVGNTFFASKHHENTPLMLEMSLVIFINANRRGKGPRRINIWLKLRYSAR